MRKGARRVETDRIAGKHQSTGGLNRKDSQTYESLSKLSGEAFDRAYAREMVRGHEKDVNEFKQESNAAQKGEVKQYAQQTLPTLESHLQEARQMEQSVSRTGMGKTGTGKRPTSQPR